MRLTVARSLPSSASASIARPSAKSALTEEGDALLAFAEPDAATRAVAFGPSA